MTYPAKARRGLQFSATRTNRASRRRQSVNHKHLWWRDDWFSGKLGGKPFHFNNTKIMKTILRALIVGCLTGIGSALPAADAFDGLNRSEEHTSELQSLRHLVCRLLLEK